MPAGPDDQSFPEPGGIRMRHDCCDRDRSAFGDVGRDLAQFREGRTVDLLDEHVEDAAAGQSDRERRLVADAAIASMECR